MQIGTREQDAIGWHLVAHLYQHNIVYHYIAAGNLYHPPVSAHLYRLFLAQGCKDMKLLGSIPLEIEAHRCGQEYSHKDACRLHKVVLYESQDQRDQGCYKKDLDNGIAILIQIEFP